MRGDDIHQDAMFSYLSPEARVPQDHPLRPLRQMVNQDLGELTRDFQAMYSREGRPSIQPEKLLRALLLQVFYTIRSERLLMEQLDYNLLFRWFVGLSMDDKVWNHSVFSKNRERFLRSDLAAAFFRRILEQAAAAGLLSDEHFTVDGTLIEAWASLKSSGLKDSRRPRRRRPQPGGGLSWREAPEPDARLHHGPEGPAVQEGERQGGQALFMGHVLMDNRHGLVVSPGLTAATGTAEREAAVDLVEAVPGQHRITVGADKAYDTREFVHTLRALRAVPHVTLNARACLGHRRPHHPPSGLRRQSAIAQEGGGDLRLDEDRGRSPEDAAPR